VSRKPILKNFVSELDQFLQEFDHQHPILSQTQQKEVNKYRRVYKLRDGSTTEAITEPKLWEGF
jgi:hypothetical protein